jgi:hypothetical protein
MTTPAEIRAWAVTNGFPELEGKRGRLPATVIDAFTLKNKGPVAKGGTPVPGQQSRPAGKNSAPAKMPCSSAVTLPMGIEAKQIIAQQDGLCSGCENPATEVVSTLDGQVPDDPIKWTALCGSCLCEWRRRVK